MASCTQVSSNTCPIWRGQLEAGECHSRQLSLLTLTEMSEKWVLKYLVSNVGTVPPQCLTPELETQLVATSRPGLVLPKGPSFPLTLLCLKSLAQSLFREASPPRPFICGNFPDFICTWAAGRVETSRSKMFEKESNNTSKNIQNTCGRQWPSQ